MSSDATSPNKPELVAIPMDNPVYKENAVGHVGEGTHTLSASCIHVAHAHVYVFMSFLGMSRQLYIVPYL